MMILETFFGGGGLNGCKSRSRSTDFEARKERW